MKILLSTLLLFCISTNAPPRKIKVVVKILPTLAKLVRDQPIQIEVSAKDFSYSDTKPINDSLVLLFESTSASSFDVVINGSLEYADSSVRYFRTGGRFDLHAASENFQMNFPADCTINRYLGGKTCPECKNSKDIIPVVYGLLLPDMPGSPGIDYYPLGCMISSCDPAWYCKKDSLLF